MSEADVTAAATTTDTTTTTTPDPATTEVDWKSGLNDDLRGFVENKGFKDPSAMIDSYKNFEKLMGAPKDRILKLPESAEAPEWNDIYNRLGRPEKAEEYKLDAFQDEKLREFNRQAFHEAGLTTTQVDKLAAKWGEFFNQRNQEIADEAAQRDIQGDQKLKQEWGQAYNQNIEIGKRAARELGIDGDAIDGIQKALGFEKTMKLMTSLGQKLGEGEFVSGNSTTNILSPQGAKAKIDTLMRDQDFVKRYMSGDTAAREQMSRLHQMANPEA